MDRTLSVWVGAQIIYLYGTVNGTAATFTLAGGGEWRSTVPRSEDDNYLIHLEAYSANGLEGTYDYMLYYGMMPCVTNRGKGTYYNATDLNRVCHNVDYLAGILNGYGYAVTVNPKTDWTIEAIPRAADMELYLADLETLKAAFYGTTVLPAEMDNLTADEANNIEKLLAEIELNINNMVAAFVFSGELYSGEA